MKKLRRSCFLGLLSFYSLLLFGQSNLSLDHQLLNEYYRRAQLLGEFDSLSSFLLRPLNNPVFKNGPYDFGPSSKLVDKKNATIELLPILSRSKYNLKQPYGWNDGSMLPASGYQQTLSLGFAAKAWWLRAQVNPEYHYAENKAYEGFPADAADILWKRYYSSQLNYIDRPERFGTGPIQDLRLVNSFVKLDVGPVSLGLSNENLWWGPGRRNSIIMSNNARGFWHMSLNTNQAIKSPVGAFEFQLIGARLENSGYAPPESYRTFGGNFIYRPPIDEWRYLSGFTFTYQPKWIPGLSLGASRVIQQYGTLAEENNDWLAALGSFFRSEDDQTAELERDQLASVYLRYFWPKAHSEFYFEFARNDAAWDFRDFFLEPGHSAGFLTGFTKLFPFKQRKNQFIEGNIEWTILQQSANRIIRDAATFYIHGRVRQGYTNRGEIIGAGIGPANVQTLSAKWVNDLNSLGIRLERLVHNNDLYIEFFRDIQDPRRHWIDISAYALASWQLGNLLIDGEFGIIKSLNYQYQIFDQIRTPEYFVPGIDVINFSGSLNVSYFF